MTGMPEKWRKRMSTERRQVLQKQLDMFPDWTGTCRRCGEVVTGTIAELKEHGRVCKGKKDGEKSS